MNTSQEMPKYKCHKNVWALKIDGIEFDRDKAKAEDRETNGSATITPADDGYAPFWWTATMYANISPKSEATTWSMRTATSHSHRLRPLKADTCGFDG